MFCLLGAVCDTHNDRAFRPIRSCWEINQFLIDNFINSSMDQDQYINCIQIYQFHLIFIHILNQMKSTSKRVNPESTKQLPPIANENQSDMLTKAVKKKLKKKKAKKCQTYRSEEFHSASLQQLHTLSGDKNKQIIQHIHEKAQLTAELEHYKHIASIPAQRQGELRSKLIEKELQIERMKSEIQDMKSKFQIQRKQLKQRIDQLQNANSTKYREFKVENGNFSNTINRVTNTNYQSPMQSNPVTTYISSNQNAATLQSSSSAPTYISASNRVYPATTYTPLSSNVVNPTVTYTSYLPSSAMSGVQAYSSMYKYISPAEH